MKKTYCKKLTLLAICLTCFSISMPAQHPDSLWQVWQDPAQTDTNRVMAYRDYIQLKYLYSRPDSAVIKAEALHEYAVGNDYPNAAAQGFRLQGIANAIMGDYAAAEKFFKESLKTFKQIDNKSGVANSLKNIGTVKIYQGNLPVAVDYAQKALAIFEELNDPEGIAGSLDNLGQLYYEQENYETALQYAQRSLAIYEDLGDKTSVAGRLGNIGSIYWGQKNFEKALEVNQRALELNQELGNTEGVAFILRNNGSIYLQLDNPELTLENAQSALALYEKMGIKSGIADNLTNIGTVYKVQGKFNMALDFCTRGLKLADEIGALKIQKNGCKCLYDSYKALGKNTNALLYLERRQAIEDSLQADVTAKKLQQMEFEKLLLQDSIARAEEARLVKEAHQEEVRRKNQTRNVLMGSSFLLLLLAGGLYSRWRYVRKAKTVIEKEKERSENLLLNILPAEIAEELKEKGRADARNFERVSILFTDFKGFTAASEQLSAQDLVTEINTCFEAFDGIMDKYGIEKIKTIGDAYMAAGGIPVPTDDSVRNTILTALEIQNFILKRKAKLDAAGKPGFEMRVGVHTGPVVAGIVGVKKFQYDIWGDTVNTASRMESHGEAGKVNISQSTYEILKDDADFSFEPRGKIAAKGKGEVEMYFVMKR
ncbi:MAG: adenylate/guanylate cyclase domain-containing protein [Bacteroidota bacterium]